MSLEQKPTKAENEKFLLSLVGKAAKSIREELGLTQQQVADAARVGQATMSRLELQAHPRTPFVSVLAICRVLYQTAIRQQRSSFADPNSELVWRLGKHASQVPGAARSAVALQDECIGAITLTAKRITPAKRKALLRMAQALAEL